MERFSIDIKQYGEGALLLEWPREISHSILEDIVDFQSLLEVQVHEVLEFIPAYQSLTLLYDPGKIEYHELAGKVRQLYHLKTKANTMRVAKRWHIPVCYDPFFGKDLQNIIKGKQLSSSEAIELHASIEYTVFFIGFLPGFMYLGGLPEILFTPRKAIPEFKIPKGSLGIAGEQTGIYPVESPGGWHIIGNTPIPLFTKENDPPCFARPGDKVKFFPISLSEHERLSLEIKGGNFKLEHETVNHGE